MNADITALVVIIIAMALFLCAALIPIKPESRRHRPF